MKLRNTKDFETRSKSNLKKEGAYKYSLDPSTQPTCFAFKILGEPTVYFLDFYAINRRWDEQSEKLKQLWYRLIEGGYEFSAHNSFFERCIYDNILVKRYGWPLIPPRQRRCTAAKAASCALPRNLEGAGEAMRLRTQKDKRGYNAMMATCKPTKQWNAWTKARSEIAAGKKVGEKKRKLAALPEPPVFITPESHPEVFNTLYTYCKIDVLSEEQLDQSLPDLTSKEQEIWFLNQELNWRGLHVDIPTITKIVDIMSTISETKLGELDDLTAGLITKGGALKSMLEFLEMEGVEIPNMRAKTIDDKLKEFDLSDNARKLLELRRTLSYASTKKYQSFLNRATNDNRVRDILLYHGASTGRDTGTGVQPHNFPRGLLKVNKDQPYSHIQNVIDCDKDMLGLLYGENSLGILFSAVLRNMIIPSKGHELFVADFSKIEVAVLWWLADNKPGLKVLKEGKDPYIYQAAANTGKSYEEIETAVLKEEKWALDARQLGKAQILGGGFGMGWAKFQQTGWDMYRLRLTDQQSKTAIESYRRVNKAVKDVWKKYEDAAVNCIKNPASLNVGKCLFRVSKDFLWIQLPSGRRLAYREPRLTMRETDYGPKETLEFMAVNSKTKKWSLERTWGGTLTENIVQAVARDLIMEGILRLEKAGYKTLLTVHDEAICEKPVDTGRLDSFIKILCERPTWADQHLPIEAKGWVGPRYRK